MAKGWEHFSTVNDATVEDVKTKKARSKMTERMIKTVPTLSEEELKKASDERYNEMVAADDFLVAGYNDKRLKSKKLIRQARYVIKKRAEAEKKTKEAKEKAEAEVTE